MMHFLRNDNAKPANWFIFTNKEKLSYFLFLFFNMSCLQVCYVRVSMGFTWLMTTRRVMTLTNVRTPAHAASSVLITEGHSGASVLKATNWNMTWNAAKLWVRTWTKLVPVWGTTFSWWRNLGYETRLSSRCLSLKLLSNMTYLLARLLSVYSRALALVFDWIK